jgi:hypothetical protein
MKRLILGTAFAGLLVASAASGQPLRSPTPDQWLQAEVSRPAPLALRDATIGVDASLPSPGSLRLGEFTVVRLQDRVVRLRFTMTSVPPPAIPPSAPRGQALATVDLDVVVHSRSSGQSAAAENPEVQGASGSGTAVPQRR